MGKSGVKLKGFGKHRAALARMRRETQRADGTVVEIGWTDPGISGATAMQHEHGNPKTKLPERPVMRRSLAAVRTAVNQAIVKASQGKAAPALSGFVAGARAGALALYRAYINAEQLGLAPVGEATKKKKAGTKGADKVLTGARGPKMIDKINATVDGQKTGR